jgi:hypothetical protein
MLIKNLGAAWALTGLIGLVVVGFVFFDTERCYRNNAACIDQNNHASINNNSSPIVIIGK